MLRRPRVRSTKPDRVRLRLAHSFLLSCYVMQCGAIRIRGSFVRCCCSTPGATQLERIDEWLRWALKPHRTAKEPIQQAPGPGRMTRRPARAARSRTALGCGDFPSLFLGNQKNFDEPLDPLEGHGDHCDVRRLDERIQREPPRSSAHTKRTFRVLDSAFRIRPLPLLQ